MGASGDAGGPLAFPRLVTHPRGTTHRHTRRTDVLEVCLGLQLQVRTRGHPDVLPPAPRDVVEDDPGQLPTLAHA